MFIPTKKVLESVPFQLVYEEGMLENNQKKALAKYATWILPQALSFVGSWKVVKTAEGLNDGTATVKKAISECSLGSEWAKGLLMYLIANPRGTIFPTTLRQTGELLPYSALVPLVLAAFKKFQDIPYSTWTNINSLVDKDLMAAMTCTPHAFSTEELLDLRTLGSTVGSGKDKGSVKSPLKATTIVTTGVEVFDQLPRLAKLMLTQCWVAHPSLRHQYMVLNPNNWDDMPKPLIDVEAGMGGNTSSSTVDWDD